MEGVICALPEIVRIKKQYKVSNNNSMSKKNDDEGEDKTEKEKICKNSFIFSAIYGLMRHTVLVH